MLWSNEHNSLDDQSADAPIVSDLCSMKDRTTLVLGASPRPDRYAYMAVERLVGADIPVIAVGLRAGHIGDVTIVTEIPGNRPIHTVTLYLGPVNQEQWQERILALNPKRILFNPGTENSAFEAQAQAQGIETVRGCTLVMLAANTY